MGAVALNASIKGFHVGKIAIVGFTCIFITTLGQGSVFGSCGSIIMDIPETKSFSYCVQINIIHIFNTSGFQDLGINTNNGFSALVAFHTAGLVTQASQFQTGGHNHTVFLHYLRIVAGSTLHTHHIDATTSFSIVPAALPSPPWKSI